MNCPGPQDEEEQMMAAKRRKLEASEGSTRISEKKQAENRLKALEREFAKDSAKYYRHQEKIVRSQAKLDAIQMELSDVSFSVMRQAELKERERALKASVHEKRDRCNEMSARLPRCNFQYQPPEPGFDSSRVLGPICRLFELKDPLYCTALAVIARERLFYVMVDDWSTIKLLETNGQLKEPTDFMTLNSIGGIVMDRDLLAVAQEIGGGPENVELALDLVSYDSSLEPTMTWLFGNTLVCSDLTVASDVTFHPRIKNRCRCVTRDGVEVDPEDFYTGGGPPVEEAVILIQLTELKQLEKDLKTAEAQLSQCTAELQAVKNYPSLQRRYEKKSHELNVMKARLAKKSYAQTHEKIESLKAQLRE